MLVSLAVRLLFPFALEGCANFPCPFVITVLDVSAARPSGDKLQGHGLRDEAVYFFLDNVRCRGLGGLLWFHSPLYCRCGIPSLIVCRLRRNA